MLCGLWNDWIEGPIMSPRGHQFSHLNICKGWCVCVLVTSQCTFPKIWGGGVPTSCSGYSWSSFCEYHQCIFNPPMSKIHASGEKKRTKYIQWAHLVATSVGSLTELWGGGVPLLRQGLPKLTKDPMYSNYYLIPTRYEWHWHKTNYTNNNIQVQRANNGGT